MMPVDYEQIRRNNIREYGEGTRHLDILRALYNKRTHFIYELLQNADDAEAKRVLFELDADRFVCRHDGRSFNEEDVIGICAVCNSTKTSNLNKIGKFGIGFKSVYNYTRTPQVHSGNEHFRIDHYIRPHQIEPQPEVAGYGTSFVLPFNAEIDAATSVKEITRELESLLPRHLLFLNHLDLIEFRVADGPLVSLAREIVDQSSHAWANVSRESEESRTSEDWLLFHRAVWREHTQGQNRVQIAFKLAVDAEKNDRQIERLSSPPLYVSFPTARSMQTGCIIQGPFRTNPARDSVPDADDWNRHLAKETARLLVDALPLLRELGLLTPESLQCLPIDRSAFPESSLFEPLFTTLKQALSRQPFLPAEDGSWVAASTARLAGSDDVRGLVDAPLLDSPESHSSATKWLSGDITTSKTPVLRRFLVEQLGIPEIRFDQLMELLTDEFLASQPDEWMTRLYQFLLLRKRQWSSPGSTRSGDVLKKPIIRLECGRHVAPFDDEGAANAYLPTSVGSTFPIVKRSIASDPVAQEFLKGLGITEPDLADEVLLRVLPKYAEKSGGVPDDQQAYLDDLSLIVTSLQLTDSMPVEKWERLMARLQETPFLLAEDFQTGRTALKQPQVIYQGTPELIAHFAGRDDVWFLKADLTKQIEPVLSKLQIASLPRLQPFNPSMTDQQLAELRGGQKSMREESLTDYDLDGLANVLSEIQHASPELARVKATSLWDLLDRLFDCDNGRRWEGEHRWHFRTEQIRRFPARFVRTLQAESWLPNMEGALRRPTELSVDDLPDGFYAHGRLIKALGLRDPESDVAKHRAEALQAYGVTEDDLAWIREDPQGFQRWREETERSRMQVQFPDRPSSSPSRRELAVKQETLVAPGKHFEYSNRSVRASRPGVDAKTWLRHQYTNDLDQMLCQMTHEVMPFRKRNGQHYFEAVEISDAFEKEHRAVYLALSPVAAAKYKEFIKSDPQMMTEFCEAIRASNGNEIPLALGDENVLIRFTDQHILDLRTVLTQLAGLPRAAETAPSDRIDVNPRCIELAQSSPPDSSQRYR